MRTTRRARSRLVHAVLPGLLGSVLGAPILACSVASPGAAPPADAPEVNPPAPAVDAGGAAPDATPPPDARALFAAIEPALVAACGGCHGAGGIAGAPFLAGPDVYRSIVGWPGVVMNDYRASLLLTHPVSGGGHSGVNLDSDAYKDTLLPGVVAWLEAEARALAGGDAAEASPSIGPIAPILGFNVVRLDALGAPFEGIAITFDADEPTDALLLLSDIEVHPTARAGVHLVHPLLVAHRRDADPAPDPADTFSGLDQVVLKGRPAPLGGGLALLTSWRRGAELSIAFEAITPFDGASAPGDDAGACSALGAFLSDARAPLAERCGGCHGGGDAAATAALDMSGLEADVVAACASIRKWSNLDDPPESEIFVTTDPARKASHPFKFNADVRRFEEFRAAVSAWLEAERR